MEASLPPEGGPVPRPRPTVVRPTEAAPARSLPPHTAAERRLIEAVEELGSARIALGLPVNRFTPDTPIELTPEQRAKESWVAGYMAEIEAGSAGPFPDPIEDLAPPADPDAFLVGGFIRPGT